MVSSESTLAAPPDLLSARQSRPLRNLKLCDTGTRVQVPVSTLPPVRSAGADLIGDVIATVGTHQKA